MSDNVLRSIRVVALTLCFCFAASCLTDCSMHLITQLASES